MWGKVKQAGELSFRLMERPEGGIHMPVDINRHIALSSTYGHSQLKTGHPVRSAIHKQLNGRLVLRWVTTWESLLLYVLYLFCPVSFCLPRCDDRLRFPCLYSDNLRRLKYQSLFNQDQPLRPSKIFMDLILKHVSRCPCGAAMGLFTSHDDRHEISCIIHTRL